MPSPKHSIVPAQRATSTARYTLVLLCLALALVTQACQEASSPEVTPFEPGQLLAARPAEALLLDVRSPEEFAAGHVPGATNVPHAEVAGRVSELGDDRARPVIVYCESGRRAQRAETALLAAGFTDVRHLEGDIRAWRDAGRPIERAETAPPN